MTTEPTDFMPSSRILPLIVATALLMENLDSTVIATSLPRIAVDLGTSAINLKLALTTYLLTLAIFIPASGWMADRFGARTIFRLAIIVFVAGSIACGASNSLGTLVLSRALQGIGGSMMVPVGRLIVLRTTAKGNLVNALAWLAMPALLGPVLGPVLGGFITTYIDWRWIFWINVPIALLGLTLATIFVPKIPVEAVPRFDVRGFMLVGPGLAAFLTGMTMAGMGLVPDDVLVALMLGGVVLVALYVRHAMRAEAPLIDLHLLRWPTFRIAALGGVLFRTGSGGTPFLLPLFFQLGFGLSAFQSGLVTFASGVGAIAMKLIAQPLLQRFGFRRVLLWNGLLAGAFIAMPATFSAAMPYTVMIGLLFVGGFCRSLQFTAINSMSYADVRPERLGSATAFNSLMQQLARTIGITLAGVGLQVFQDIGGLQQVVATTFPPVFVLMAGISLLSTVWWLRLTSDAGGALLLRAPARRG